MILGLSLYACVLLLFVGLPIAVAFTWFGVHCYNEDVEWHEQRAERQRVAKERSDESFRWTNEIYDQIDTLNRATGLYLDSRINSFLPGKKESR